MGVGGKHFENQHEGVLKERWALVVSTLKIKPRGGGKHFENQAKGF